MSIYKGVEDTLFIPLTARIYVSKRFPKFFFDKKALTFDGKIDDYIETKSDEYTMLASVVRYYRTDKEITRFCSKNKVSNVVFLGAGLETAYSRLDDKLNNYYEVDLPNVIKAREELIGSAENDTLIACSMFDMKWTESIDVSLPTIVVVNGVFQYFKRDEIIQLIKDLKDSFSGKLEIIFDATNQKGLIFANKYVKKTGNSSAMMYFYINDPNDFAKTVGATLINVYPFFKGTVDVIKKKLKLKTKIYMKFADAGGRAKIIHLKLK